MKGRSFVGRISPAVATAPWLLRSTLDISELRDFLGTASDEPALWREVRNQFLLGWGLIHLHSATIGATPRSD